MIRLCSLSDIPDADARGFEVSMGKDDVLILVVRKGDHVHGYRNSCPHVGVPLDTEPDRFFDLTGQYLQCSYHGAIFVPETGQCVRGPCRGSHLETIPLHVLGGFVFWDAKALDQSPRQG